LKNEDFAPFRLFFDREGKPSERLLTLLGVLGMETLNPQKSESAQINAWAQKNLLRKGERWQCQSTQFENLRTTLLPLLTDLGFVNAVSPHFTHYQGAIVHGSLLQSARLRLHCLIEQWQRGVRFTHLYFLTGERPLEEQYENRQTLTQDGDSPLKIKKGWREPDALAETEVEIMQLIWEQSDIPEEMLRQVEVHFISAPRRKDPTSGKMVRPTTDDTVEMWLKASPPPGLYLTVSNAPYTNRQDLVTRTIAPSLYTFDTIGARAAPQEKMAVFLDEFARLIFQMTKLQIDKPYSLTKATVKWEKEGR
jgi:hypothetical protein